MKKKLTLVLILLVSLIFNIYRYPFLKFILTIGLPKEEVPYDMKEKYNTYHQISSQINECYKLDGYIIGSKNNISQKKVEGLSFYFQKIAQLSLNQAREISMRVLLECILKINESKNLEKYLLPFPFTDKNINLTLVFEDELKISHNCQPLIGSTSFLKESFHFKIYKYWGSYELLSSETESFEEAYMKTKPKLPPNLQRVAEDSLRLSKERQKTEVEPIEYPNDDSHPDRVATRQWIEKSQAPRDAKGYLIPDNPSK